MSALFIILTLLTAGAIQSLLPAWSIMGPLKPPLLLSLIIYFPLHVSRSRALCAAVLAGFIHDTFCPAPLGISIPFFVLVALNVILVRKEVFSDQLLTYVIFGAMGTVLQTVYFAVVLGISGLRPLWLGAFTLRLLGSLIAGAVVCPLVYFVVSQAHRLITKEKERAG
jgi:rod shape-determining protein MreD